MIVKRFVVNPYEWEVTFIKYPHRKDIKKVKKIIKPICLTRKDFNKIIKQVKEKDGTRTSGARHLANMVYMKTVIILYKQDNKNREIISLCHEKRHLEDHILNHCGINDYEASAYLAGYLAKKLF